MPIKVIYNGFWNPAPPDTVQKLVAAASCLGIPAEAIAHHTLHPVVDGDISVAGVTTGDVVLFFDKDVRLARSLEGIGAHVFNSAAAIALCDDKAATHIAMAGAGIPQPRTLIAPLSYRPIDERIEPFLRYAESVLPYPMVVKECYGSLGNQVYLAENADRLRAVVLSVRERPFLIQQYIETDCTDKRLYVVDGCVVAAMKRIGQQDFRANIGLGGVGEPYEPTAAESALAVACCQRLGLLFGGVDLLTDREQQTYLCEVNSNAQLTAVTAVTGVDVASHIIRAVLPFCH